MWCWSSCTVTLCTLVERWVVCYCTVSDIGRTPMMITVGRDRTDDGFNGRAGGVCQGAIG